MHAAKQRDVGRFLRKAGPWESKAWHPRAIEACEAAAAAAAAGTGSTRAAGGAGSAGALGASACAASPAGLDAFNGRALPLDPGSGAAASSPFPRPYPRAFAELGVPPRDMPRLFGAVTSWIAAQTTVVRL